MRMRIGRLAALLFLLVLSASTATAIAIDPHEGVTGAPRLTGGLDRWAGFEFELTGTPLILDAVSFDILWDQPIAEPRDIVVSVFRGSATAQTWTAFSMPVDAPAGPTRLSLTVPIGTLLEGLPGEAIFAIAVRPDLFTTVSINSYFLEALVVDTAFPYTDSTGLIRITGGQDPIAGSSPVGGTPTDPVAPIRLHVTPVPEPGAALLYGIGVVVGSIATRNSRQRG